MFECLEAEPTFVADLSDLLAAVSGGAASMSKQEAVEAAGGAEAAATGDVGEREGGEAQQVVDEAQSVGGAEIVAGLASETADEAGEVAVAAAEAVGDGFQAVFARRERLQQKVGGVEAGGMEIGLKRGIDGLAVLVVVANLGERRNVEVVESFVSFFGAHVLESFAYSRWK